MFHKRIFRQVKITMGYRKLYWFNKDLAALDFFIESIYLLHLDAKLGVELRVELRGTAEDETGRRGRKKSSASLKIMSWLSDTQWNVIVSCKFSLNFIILVHE